MKSVKGFTLIEILVVVVIIGILAAIVVPRVITRPDEAKIVKVKEDVQAISSAAELYKLDTGDYPSSDQGLKVLVPKYLKSTPLDPWGRPYHYIEPGVHNPDSFDVFTYGANNQPGGTGMNAERGNWDEAGQ